MAFDIFISYAWGSRKDQSHRQWVSLLASHLHLIGYHVGIDMKVNYGSSLSGFMQEIADSKHVLMIADENYVERADNVPGSGVYIENQIIQDAIGARPSDWLAALFVNNTQHLLPSWIANNPKSFDFNYKYEKEEYPGSEQIEALWRWIEGLPADKTNAESPSLIRQRMCRVERIENLRDPAHWSLPGLEGKGIEFNYNEAPRRSFSLGYGSYEFKFTISSCSVDSIYVYNDYTKAVGIVPDDITDVGLDAEQANTFVRPGRIATPYIGQRVVLLNENGCICIVKIVKIRQETDDGEFIPAQVVFDYEILFEK